MPFRRRIRNTNTTGVEADEAGTVMPQMRTGIRGRTRWRSLALLWVLLCGWPEPTLYSVSLLSDASDSACGLRCKQHPPTRIPTRMSPSVYRFVTRHLLC